MHQRYFEKSFSFEIVTDTYELAAWPRVGSVKQFVLTIVADLLHRPHLVLAKEKK